ncbi:MAG: S1 RNA-binding domain-containing protein [Anaerolineales bacterium]|jgi:ribosomal protein S1
MADQKSKSSEIKRKRHYKGKVIKTTLAGAVIDIGETLPGIVHIAHLSNDPVKRVEDVVEKGQEVEVWVRKLPKGNKYIELTMIKPLELEWQEIKKGMVVKGKVIRLEKFGAFIEIGAERPGLAHISELSHEYIKTPEDAVKIGDEIEVQVIDFSRRKKQIKLSLKALQDEPAPPLKEVNIKEEEETPALTAMEIAYQKALADTEIEPQGKITTDSTERNLKSEQEEILARTLKHKAKTK